MEEHNEVSLENSVEEVNHEVLEAEQKEIIEKQVFETKNKMKKDYYIGVGVLVVAVLVVSIFSYSTMYQNGSRLIVRMVDHLKSNFQYLGEPFEDYGMMDLISDDFNGQGSIQMNISSGIFDYLDSTEEYQNVLDIMNTLNDMRLNYSFQMDTKSKYQFQMQLDSMLGDEKLMGLFVSLMDQDGYLFLDGLYDKYLKFSADGEVDDFELKQKLSSEDFDYLLDFTVQSLGRHLKEEYFERETVTISLNGKNKKVNQVSLVMNDDHFGALLDDLVSDMKDDEKVVRLLGQLDVSLNDYQTPSLDGEEFFIRMYETKFRHKLVGYELDDGDIRFSYWANQDDTFEIYSGDMMMVRATIQPNQDGYDIELTQWDETRLGSLSVKRDGEELSLEGDINYNQIRTNFSVLSHVATQDEGYSDTIQLHLGVSMAGISFLTLDVNENSTVMNGASMKDIDVSNSVLVDDLTDTEYEQIGLKLTQLMERLFGTDLSLLD